VGIGKLNVDPDELVAGIEASGFLELPIHARHTIGVLRLPDLHRDPFDRLLIAQALYEPMRFLTADTALKQYSDLIDVI
jgi:PIN domain nuclease of toxin-antitoxin system